jgi:hypothetical protein
LRHEASGAQKYHAQLDSVLLCYLDSRKAQATLAPMQWLAATAIIFGAIIGTGLLALVVAIGIQVWHERSTVDLPMKDD